MRRSLLLRIFARRWVDNYGQMTFNAVSQAGLKKNQGMILSLIFELSLIVLGLLVQLLTLFHLLLCISIKGKGK